MFNTILSFTILFFIIMDPLGNLPIFISILKNFSVQKKRMIICRELLLALIIMCFFLFTGENILKILHLKIYSISIAGGLILFLISIKMIFPEYTLPQKNNIMLEEPFLVPLAIPLISGPSLLATLILLSKQYTSKIWYIFSAVIISWCITSIILLSSDFFSKFLGEKGLKAIEKIMGLILIMLSTQMFLDGLKIWIK
ncbi:YhgN family NAAT transporter [Buchnera aphidicola]|uniref:UPF0056 membrane protein n=1 Tax=Buchnera aphidicola subsp. Tuberolachnus salignus TaxID=98804 RepID=A0A160SXM2_BUCTT|nr:YhgN family NAAT transporter [Buchnera aphidicola]CUR53265.1 UPF0056 inner membrane protein YhgN [Buchnera aphidicola (Tuberolachnus salignus)]